MTTAIPTLPPDAFRALPSLPGAMHATCLPAVAALARLTVALVLAAAGWATASAAPVANGVAITSVSPDPANRSVRVVVTGHGFGARNATLRLGGQPIAPDVALGSRLEFVVPALSPVGELPLEVENPGGIVARGSLTVRFDGRVQPEVDRSRTVTQTVGPAGGALTAGEVTLMIPPGALLAPVAISMSPLARLVGSPLAPVFDAVQLEPSGLTLLKPATLSMPLRAPAADLVTFLYEEDGVEMHLAPWWIEGQTVKVLVSHFSGGGSAGAGNASSMFSFSPSNAQARAEQQIAVALNALANGQIDQAQFDAMIDLALDAWSRSVLNGFGVAQTGPLDYFEFAVADWQAWAAMVAAYGREDALASLVAARRTTARLVAITHARRILAACTGADPNPFAPVREMTRLAGILVVDEGVFDLTAEAPDLANGQNLVFQCMRVKIDRFDGPPVFARGNPPRNTIRLEAQVLFASGALRRDIPLVFEVDEMRNSVSGPTNLVNEVVNTGTLSRQVEIAGLDGGSRGHLKAHARLAAQAGDPSLNVFDVEDDLSRDVRSRTELTHLAGGSYVADLASLQAGRSAAFRVRLAGDGVDQQPALAFSAAPQVGTLTPSAANANASGEASFTYDVPTGTSPQQVCVRVDWTHAGAAEGDFDCFAITASSTPPPPPPPPPPPQFDPTYATYTGVWTSCVTDGMGPTDCWDFPLRIYFTRPTLAGTTHTVHFWEPRPALCWNGRLYSHAVVSGGSVRLSALQCGNPDTTWREPDVTGTVDERSLFLLIFDGPKSNGDHLRQTIEASRELPP